MSEEITPRECAREREDERGELFACDGYMEVRVPFYFNLQTDGSLNFSLAGDGDGGEGITINCNECGAAGHRVLYAGITEAVHDLETRLGGMLARN